MSEQIDKTTKLFDNVRSFENEKVVILNLVLQQHTFIQLPITPLFERVTGKTHISVKIEGNGKLSGSIITLTF